MTPWGPHLSSSHNSRPAWFSFQVEKWLLGASNSTQALNLPQRFPLSGASLPQAWGEAGPLHCEVASQAGSAQPISCQSWGAGGTTVRAGGTRPGCRQRWAHPTQARRPPMGLQAAMNVAMSPPALLAALGPRRREGTSLAPNSLQGLWRLGGKRRNARRSLEAPLPIPLPLGKGGPPSPNSPAWHDSAMVWPGTASGRPVRLGLRKGWTQTHPCLEVTSVTSQDEEAPTVRMWGPWALGQSTGACSLGPWLSRLKRRPAARRRALCSASPPVYLNKLGYLVPKPTAN